MKNLQLSLYKESLNKMHSPTHLNGRFFKYYYNIELDIQFYIEFSAEFNNIKFNI